MKRNYLVLSKPIEGDGAVSGMAVVGAFTMEGTSGLRQSAAAFVKSGVEEGRYASLGTCRLVIVERFPEDIIQSAPYSAGAQ